MESKSLEILAELHEIENEPNVFDVKTALKVFNLEENELINVYGLITKTFMKAIQDQRVKNNEPDEDCDLGLIFFELMQSNERMLKEFYPDIIEDSDESELFDCDNNVIN